MATRTSTRSTKAVKFVEEDEEDFRETSTTDDATAKTGTTVAATTDAAVRVKNEPKKGKSRGRPRRQRGSDDEDWQAANEQSEDEEDEEEEEEDDDATDRTPKKYKGNAANRSTGDSVYDFGEMPGASPRKWTKTVTPQRNSAVVDAGKSGEKLMCSYCNYTTTKKYLLQRHLKSHSTERPHKCAYCDRSFKTTIQLTNHVNTHLGVKPFQCKFCSFSFTTSGELIRHVRYKHTLEKPHRCDECGYATVELSKLRRHIRTHTGEKPYACPHCSYCSPDTFKLKRHLRVHTGERPYQCTICNFRFTQSNSLKAHMLTHQAEKPSFPCSYCPSVMARKSDLRYHIGKQHARQSEPLPSNKSDEEFPDKYSHRAHANTSQQIDEHVPKHRGTRPFQCSECGLMFAARADLRAHVTRTHRNLSSTPTTTNVAVAPRRPQRRAASLQHRYIGTSSGAEDEDPTHPSQQQDEDDYRCPICHRQFTSARLLDRHTYAVHEPKHDSYDDRDYHQQETMPIEEDDDVRDYADDELEEKNPIILPKPLTTTTNHFDEGLIGDADEDDDQQGLIDEEEFDLAPNVEDIIDEDDETFNEPISTIKSISSGNRKQMGIVRKFEDLEQDPNENFSNKRKCSTINRNTYKSMVDEKTDFDVFGFDG